ncbi:MAG: acyltransferase, partial [Betaproteobacteria bacterium]
MDVICCQQRPTLSPLGMPTAAPAHHHMVHTRRARDRAVQANLGEDSPVTDEAAASEETTPHVAAVGAAAARTPMTIADFAVSRDNNFNLIRFRAASAVLVSHSYALSTGDPKTEPLRAWLGFSAGDIAVDVFFLTSGFLVAGSLFSRRSVFSFALARALRIYPAMLVSVALTVLIVGMWFSSSAATSFITNSDTWRYIWKNATLVFGIAYKLPGAFEHAPSGVAVNGSLWSLPYELTMYGVLAAAWLGLATLRLQPEKRFSGVVACIFLTAVSVELLGLTVPRISALAWHLTAMFFAGSSLYAFRRRVPLDARLFAVLLLALAASSMSKGAFAVVYLFSLPYLVIYLAYVPGGVLRRFNRLGDYSYGIYIYAFPVQQMLAASAPGIRPLQMLAASFPITLLLAIASWHS